MSFFDRFWRRNNPTPERRPTPSRMELTAERPSLHVFISYTTREYEVAVVQPLVDQYCNDLWQWAQQAGIKILYDHFSIERRDYYHACELESLLMEAMYRTELFTAFVSPGYLESDWCRFEWANASDNPNVYRPYERPHDRPCVIHPIYWKPISRDLDFERYIGPDIFGRKLTDVTPAYDGRESLMWAVSKSYARGFCTCLVGAHLGTEELPRYH